MFYHGRILNEWHVYCPIAHKSYGIGGATIGAGGSMTPHLWKVGGSGGQQILALLTCLLWWRGNVMYVCYSVYHILCSITKFVHTIHPIIFFARDFAYFQSNISYMSAEVLLFSRVNGIITGFIVTIFCLLLSQITEKFSQRISHPLDPHRRSRFALSIYYIVF